jgi:hypothetical protein
VIVQRCPKAKSFYRQVAKTFHWQGAKTQRRRGHGHVDRTFQVATDSPPGRKTARTQSRQVAKIDWGGFGFKDERYGTGAVATALTKPALRSGPRMVGNLNRSLPLPYCTVDRAYRARSDRLIGFPYWVASLRAILLLANLAGLCGLAVMSLMIGVSSTARIN